MRLRVGDRKRKKGKGTFGNWLSLLGIEALLLLLVLITHTTFPSSAVLEVDVVLCGEGHTILLFCHASITSCFVVTDCLRDLECRQPRVRRVNQRYNLQACSVQACHFSFSVMLYNFCHCGAPSPTKKFPSKSCSVTVWEGDRLA